MTLFKIICSPLFCKKLKKNFCAWFDFISKWKKWIIIISGSHYDLSEIESQCIFYLSQYFSYFYLTFSSLFENSVEFICPLFIGSFVFGIKILKFFMDSGYLPHTICILGKYFFHSVSSIFTQMIVSFAVPKPFSFCNSIYQSVIPCISSTNRVLLGKSCIYLYLRVYECLWIPVASLKFQETHIYSCIHDMKAGKRLIEKRKGASWSDLATDEDSREEIMMKIHDILENTWISSWNFLQNKC